MTIRHGLLEVPIVGTKEDVSAGYALNDELTFPRMFKVVGGLSGTVDGDAHVKLSSGQEVTMPAKDLHEINAMVVVVYDDADMTLDDFYLWG